MPLYLTKALIPYDIAAKREAAGRPAFADPYAWHQRAWEAFPNRDQAPRDFLTRLDPKDEALQLLLLSATAPTRPPWCPDGTAWQVKEIPESFTGHPRYRFSLLANPTRKVRSNAQGVLLKNSRRVPILHREDRPGEDGSIRPGLVSWLARQGAKGGFTADPDSLETITLARQSFVRPAKSGQDRHTGTLHAVDFRGVLTVTDPAAFRQSFATGIGSAKAFGFGLLCMSPLL